MAVTIPMMADGDQPSVEELLFLELTGGAWGVKVEVDVEIDRAATVTNTVGFVIVDDIAAG